MTPPDLVGIRFVVRRGASDDGRDERVGERQTVVWMLRRRLVGEAGLVHRAHEKVARSSGNVAGEDTSRAVGAVRGRREAEDEHARIRIAEAGNGARPVHVVAVRRVLLTPDALTVTPQARAGIARDDRVANLVRLGTILLYSGFWNSDILTEIVRFGLFVRVIGAADEWSRLHVAEPEIQRDAFQFRELGRRVVAIHWQVRRRWTQVLADRKDSTAGLAQIAKN